MTEVAERPSRAGTLGATRGQSLAQSLRKLSEYQLPSRQSEREAVFRRFEEEEKAKLEGSGGEPRESEKPRLRPQSLYIGPGGSYGPAVGDQEPDSDEDIVGLSEEERAERAQKRKNREKQRKAVLAEIVTTEKAYVDNLSILMRHFYQPLVDAANEAGRVSLKKSRKVNEENIPILRPDELQNIFGNIEAIYQKHVAFLAKLEEREKAWKEDEKEDRIGDVFYIGTQFFIMYSPYVLNYDKSLETVQALMTEKRFASHVTLICGHPELKGLDLSNYLIMPVQRLPRYILLLTELVKATPRKHADYPALQRCLANVKAAAEVCNTRKELSASGKRERIRKRSSTYSTLPQLSPKEDEAKSAERTPREKSPRKDKDTSPRKDGELTPEASKKTPAPSSAPAKMQRSKSSQKMRHAGSAIVAGSKEEKASRRHTMARQTDGGELLFLLHREKEKQHAAELMEKEMKNKEKQIPRITTKGEVSAFFVEPTGLPLSGNPTLNL